MDKEELHNMLSIVESALEKILLAELITDKRSREKNIREAKEEAQNMVYPYKARLTEICHMENLGNELFDWGFLKGDLQEVRVKLKEMCDSI